MPNDNSSITATEARALFAPFAKAPALMLAVSGGPDSTALLWLAARWRKARRSGPRLIAVTVDHGLRAESAAEARTVKRLATSLDIPHVTKRWRGQKPETGIPAAAREARYALLLQAAKKAGATHILTAHTQDDQAETVLMRLAKGSGLTGLAAMVASTPLGDVQLTRPFLGIPKARLVATLDKARIPYVTDPTNADATYLRPRLRALLPQLAAEGLDAGRLSRLAARMARANDALERMTDEAALALCQPNTAGFDSAIFGSLPEEIRIRLLHRMIADAGHEGQAGLAQIETLAAAMIEAIRHAKPLRQTLAGALIMLAKGRLSVAAAPPRRVVRR